MPGHQGARACPNQVSVSLSSNKQAWVGDIASRLPADNVCFCLRSKKYAAALATDEL